MSKGIQVTASVDKIMFDHEDEVTQGYNPDTCGYYVYHNTNLIHCFNPQSEITKCSFVLTDNQLKDPNGVVRVLVKDHG